MAAPNSRYVARAGLSDPPVANKLHQLTAGYLSACEKQEARQLFRRACLIRKIFHPIGLLFFFGEQLAGRLEDRAENLLNSLPQHFAGKTCTPEQLVLKT